MPLSNVMGHEVIFFRYFNYFTPRNEQKPYFFCVRSTSMGF